MEKRQKIILIIEILVIILFLMIFGSGLLISPFNGDINLIDEGQFGAWISHMLHGKLLYKDMYVTYGPLLVYPLYIFSKFFGQSAFLVRLYFTLSGIGGMLLALLLLYKLKLKVLTRSIILIFLLIIPAVQVRELAGFLIIYLLLQKKYHYVYSLLIGSLLGITFLISPEIAVFSILTISLFYFYELIIAKNISITLRKILLVGAGISAVSLAFFLWAIRGGWFIFYLKTTIDVLQTFSGIALPNGQNFPNILSSIPHQFTFRLWIEYLSNKDFLLYWILLIYLATLFYSLVCFLQRKLNWTVALIVFYGLALFSILIGRSGHIFSVMAPVIILAGYFAEKLVLQVKHDKKTSGKFLALVILILIALMGVRVLHFFPVTRTDIQSFPEHLTSKKNNPTYVGPIAISDDQRKYIRGLQIYVAAHTTKTDTVFFFNDEPMMYLLVNRDNPTRYDLPFLANTLEKRREIIRDLKTNKPKYIFLSNVTWAVDGVSNQQRLPEVYQYLQTHYAQTGEIDNVIIYRRN